MFWSPSADTQFVAGRFLTSAGQNRMLGVESSLEHNRKLSIQNSSVTSMVPPFVMERFHGNLSLLSLAQIFRARAVCFKLLTQAMCFALALLEESAVKSS